ncbi:MAG: hypothetical protein MN733_10775 [Nitrososphaera sp.]|nr:hypothetical protein [Nitrososphaera sp.]
MIKGRPHANLFRALMLIAVLIPQIADATPQTYRDESAGFQISYPSDWVQTTPTSPGIKWEIVSNYGSGPDVIWIAVARFSGDEKQFMKELRNSSDDVYLSDLRKKFPGAKIAKRDDTYLGGFPAYTATINYPVRSLDFEAEGVSVHVLCINKGKFYVVTFETFTPYFEDSYPKFVAILASFLFLI